MKDKATTGLQLAVCSFAGFLMLSFFLIYLYNANIRLYEETKELRQRIEVLEREQ